MKLIFKISFLLIFSYLQGQNKKFDLVSYKDLSVTVDEDFPDASAVVLIKDINLQYGRILFVKERIKIINRDGFDFGTMKIKFTNVLELKASIYNLENGKIVKTDLTKKDIFIEKVDEDSKITKLIFPNVKEGSVIEVSYKVEYVTMSRINTQYFIPIKKLTIAIENPNYFELRYSQNPLSDIHLKVIKNPVQYIFTGTNINPLKDEEYVYNINNYRGKVYIERFYLHKGEKISNWSDVTEKFNDYDWFGEELKKSGGIYKNDLKRIVESATDTLDLMKSIYFHVQDRMTWDKSYSRGCNNIRKIYIEKEGDMGDINFILISMLRKAGINANPLILSSKNNGYIHAPTLKRFNCVVAAVEYNDKLYKLDASRENAGFNELSRDLMNGEGLIIYKDDSYKIVPMYSNKLSNRITIVNTTFNTDDLSANGDVKMRIDNYLAWKYRDKYGNNKEEKYIENVESNFNLVTITNLKTKGVDDLEKPISLSYDFEYNEFIEIINGDIYFKPLLYFGRTENSLKEENRKYPLNYGDPVIKKYIFNYKIPEGYQLKNLPKGKNIYLEDDSGSLKYNINLLNDTIQVILTLTVLNASIPADYYKAIKELFSEHLIISESRIVLSKI